MQLQRYTLTLCFWCGPTKLSSKTVVETRTYEWMLTLAFRGKGRKKLLLGFDPFSWLFQMLSMRNGLISHLLWFPQGLKPMRMEVGGDNTSKTLNRTTTLPLHRENSLRSASNLPDKLTMMDQSLLTPPSYIIESKSSVLAHAKPFKLKIFRGKINSLWIIHMYLRCNGNPFLHFLNCKSDIAASGNICKPVRYQSSELFSNLQAFHVYNLQFILYMNSH